MFKALNSLYIYCIYMYQKEFQIAYFVFLRFESDIKNFVLSTLERLSSGNTCALIDLCKKLAILFKSQNSK